eukprot:1161640-Pelagomonas_calceolata.AAC.3
MSTQNGRSGASSRCTRAHKRANKQAHKTGASTGTQDGSRAVPQDGTRALPQDKTRAVPAVGVLEQSKAEQREARLCRWRWQHICCECVTEVV